MSKFGRPLWGAITRPEHSSYISVRELQRLAMQKLTGLGLAPGSYSLKGNRNACLAILASLFPLSITPGVMPSSALVASHLAVCTYVSEDRSGMIPIYISEPLVASQAIRHLLEVNRLIYLIEELRTSIAQSVVTAGSIGEIISPLFLLLVSAAATKTSGLSPPSSSNVSPTKSASTNININTSTQTQPQQEDTKVHGLDESQCWATVEDFVNTLGCESIIQSVDSSTMAKKMPGKLAKAIVNFNHFIGITYTPTVKQLREAFIRRAAFVAMHQQRGADRFIPIMLSPSSERRQPFHIRESDISVIYIQDKNREENRDFVDAATYKLTHTYVHNSKPSGLEDKPYLSIYCQWGNNEQQQLIPWQLQEAHHFSMARWGIDIKSLELSKLLRVAEGEALRDTRLNDLQAQLDELQKARPDPLALLTNTTEKKRLMSMVPLRYTHTSAHDSGTAMDTS